MIVVSAQSDHDIIAQCVVYNKQRDWIPWTEMVYSIVKFVIDETLFFHAANEFSYDIYMYIYNCNHILKSKYHVT